MQSDGFSQNHMILALASASVMEMYLCVRWANTHLNVYKIWKPKNYPEMYSVWPGNVAREKNSEAVVCCIVRFSNELHLTILMEILFPVAKEGIEMSENN